MGVFEVLVVFAILLLPLLYLRGKEKRKRMAEAVDYFGGAPWYPIVGTTFRQLTTPRESELVIFHNLMDPKRYFWFTLSSS